MNKDWFFKDETNICNFRSAGVLIRGEKIFLQRERDGSEYAIPGGHVKIGETAQQSLIREYREETDVDIVCDRLIWVEESFWKWGGKNTSTIVFYYLISLTDDALIPDDYFESQKDNSEVVLEWIYLHDLKNLTVYPRFLAEKAEKILNTIEHFVSVE